jgi:hypothetical protein
MLAAINTVFTLTKSGVDGWFNVPFIIPAALSSYADAGCGGTPFDTTDETSYIQMFCTGNSFTFIMGVDGVSLFTSGTARDIVEGNPLTLTGSDILSGGTLTLSE